jgi:hypothetical protein
MGLVLGKLFKGIVPCEWNVRLWKEGEHYVLEYEERVKRPTEISTEEFRNAVERTLQATRMAMVFVDPNFWLDTTTSDDESVVKLRVRGSLGMLAGSLAMEFLVVSDFGKMTLSDIIFGMGATLLAGTMFRQQDKTGYA